MEENLVKILITSVKCGSCGQHYEEDEVGVLERGVVH